MVGPDRVRVYIAVGFVDMRKAIDGLSILVSQRFSLDPLSGHMFAFSNRQRTMVKVLYWDLCAAPSYVDQQAGTLAGKGN